MVQLLSLKHHSLSLRFLKVKSKKQQVRYEDTGIALANRNDFAAGLQVRIFLSSCCTTSRLFLSRPSAIHVVKKNSHTSIFLCYHNLQDSDDQDSDDNDDDDDDVGMDLNFDEGEIFQNQYFARAAANALRQITDQRGEALFYPSLLLLSLDYYRSRKYLSGIIFRPIPFDEVAVAPSVLQIECVSFLH